MVQWQWFCFQTLLQASDPKPSTEIASRGEGFPSRAGGDRFLGLCLVISACSGMMACDVWQGPFWGCLLLKAASGGPWGPPSWHSQSTVGPPCWPGHVWASLLQRVLLRASNSSRISGSNLPGGPQLEVPGHFSLTRVTQPEPQLPSASTENELLMPLLFFSLRPGSVQVGPYLSP